jgi:hypothetical protein
MSLAGSEVKLGTDCRRARQIVDQVGRHTVPDPYQGAGVDDGRDGVLHDRRFIDGGQEACGEAYWEGAREGLGN